MQMANLILWSSIHDCTMLIAPVDTYKLQLQKLDDAGLGTK